MARTKSGLAAAATRLSIAASGSVTNDRNAFIPWRRRGVVRGIKQSRSRTREAFDDVGSPSLGRAVRCAPCHDELLRRLHRLSCGERD
jgi:hypothetical protein